MHNTFSVRRATATPGLRICALLAPLLACRGEVFGGDDPVAPSDFESAPGAEAVQQREQDIVRCTDDRAPPLARDVHLREVALYQTVKVPLYADGAWITRGPLPVIADKQALLRVFVDPLEGYAPRTLRAVARVRGEAGETQLADSRVVTEASSEDATFEIPLPKEVVRAGASLSVTLEETDCDAQPGEAEHARAPKVGSGTLRTEALGSLRLVLVPVTVGGRKMRIDDAVLATIRASAHAFMPVPRIAIDVHAPIDGGGPVRDGADWEELLDRVQLVRARERPGDDVYYVGLFQPAATRAAHCQGQCQLGLAPLNLAARSGDQAAVVAFFGDPSSGESVVHELGHAHGLRHVACPSSIVAVGIDPNYPHPDGTIGASGWDSRTHQVMPPELHDLMSYCPPYGISAYSYAQLAERSRQVNLSLSLQRAGAQGGAYRALRWHPGRAPRFRASEQVEPPTGPREVASVRDASDREIARIELGVVRFSHSDGAVLTLPAPGPDWVSIVWGSERITLADVLPPRAW